MKTKKILFTAFLLLSMVTHSIAQSGTIEARFDIGYGLPSNPQSVTNVSGSTYTDVPYSMGSGFNADLSGSYFFSDFIGAGLNLGYVAGMPTTYTTNAGALQLTSTLQGYLFSITPFVVLTANNPGINPYARLGLVLGAPSATISTTAAGTNAPSGTQVYTATGNMALGFYGSVGVEFPLGGNFSLNAEIFDRALQWEPGQVENTETFDGQSKAKTVTYSHSVTNPSSTNQVSSYSTLYSPFSSVGINIGINMKFGGK